MPRSSYIKPNSRTQQACRDAHDIVRQICARTHMTVDEWRYLMFESGWQAVQQQEENEEVRKYILQDVRCGFWAWWITVYLAHDADMLETDIQFYRRQKQLLSQQARIDLVTDTFLNK